MKDAIVIGCGIIGATVSAALKRKGLDVLTLDDGRPMGGTGPSGGHLKPSWFSGMKKADYEPAMQLLDELWGMEASEFSVWPVGLKTKVYRVDTDKVLRAERTVATVTELLHLNNYPIVKYVEDGEAKEERGRLLVVATGAWVNNLLPNISVTSKQGVSFRLKGVLKQPFIKPWAPYKQVVAHQQGPEEIWIGDGSAIIPANWTEERTKQCLARCTQAVGVKEVLETRTGLRPYCDSGKDPCFFKKVGLKTWVATGAGKSGTIAAGWVARRILDAISA